MRRYMLCPIVGTGTGSDPYRASVADLAGVNVATIIPSNPDGSPKYDFALCIVSTVNWVPVRQVTNSFLFPDYALDSRMDGIQGDTRTGMRQSVEAYDLDGQGLHLDAENTDAESYRAFVDRLAKQIEPVFNIDQFNCAEVAE